MRIILASASPRRKELLGHIFSDFEIIPAQREENAIFITPSQYVSDLAFSKAYEVAETSFGLKSQTDSGHGSINVNGPGTALIIGADTIVYAGEQVLGKPSDTESAIEMLQLLSGKRHSVYTGVTLLLLEKQDAQTVCLRNLTFSEETHVFVSDLTKQEIRAYIDTGDCFDKAGSYGIQGQFSKHIDHIEGDYFNVVGLPVSRLYREIKAHLSFLLDSSKRPHAL